MVKKEKFTYAKAGVDIFKHKKAISSLVEKVRYSRAGIGKPLKIEGHYAGLVSFGKHALALCTDGVGTKVLIADALKKYDTVGIDCIAMNVNDCICVGAEPLAFVDYIALQKTDEKLVAEVGKGLNRGAELANISIIGGETAIVPELVKGFDLAGTCLGWVKKNRIVTGAAIRPGDIIIGLKSSGIHSNGLTLARKILEKNQIGYNEKFPHSNKTFGEILLTPTKIYVREILEVIKKFRVHGLAHITGSGLRKIMRLKENVNYVIEEPIEPQPVFKIIQELGNIEDAEMYQTFNMGMGFCIIADSENADEILEFLVKRKTDAKLVGGVAKGRGVCLQGLDIKYNNI